MESVSDANRLLIAKRELVLDLKYALRAKFDAGDMLDKRAIELFKFSSAVLGIVGGLGVVLKAIPDDEWLAIGFAILLILYIAHTIFLWLVIKPSEYALPPGLPQVTDTLASFEDDYINGGIEGYLEQMIMDLAGDDEITGAVLDAERVNEKKASGLNGLGLTFVGMVVLLLAMAAYAIGFL